MSFSYSDLRDAILEEIASQTKFRAGVGWCLTDAEIRAMKRYPSGGSYGAGEPERHTYCPDEDERCQHGDDENCPALDQQHKR